MKSRHIGSIIISIAFLFLMSQIGLAYFSDYINTVGMEYYLSESAGYLAFSILLPYYIIFAVIDRVKKKKEAKSPIL